MYTSEKISDSSYTEIQLLYRLAFGINCSLDSIKNKYATEIFGLKNVGLIAKDEMNNPAAYYGVFPTILEYNSKDFLVAQSGDTMTAPNHQKKGLFIKLAKETYELSEKLGIKLIFGFPNENSYPGFKNKLNWIFTDSMQIFVFSVPTIPFCELSSKYKILQPLYDKFVSKRISRYKTDIHSLNLEKFNYSEVSGQIKKNLNFFYYKLQGDNTFLIKANGFTILLKAKTHLMIGAIEKFEKSECKNLIQTLKKLSKKLGCRKIIFTLSKNHWLFDYLKDETKPIESLPIGFYIIDKSINPNEIQFTGADYDTF